MSHTRWNWAIWPLLLLVLCFISLRLGVTNASWTDVWQSLGADPQGQAGIIAQYRLPRICAAIVVGVHFALAGLIMQIVLRNPLADPTIFGISGGASLAIVGTMAISLFFTPISDQTISVSTDYIPLDLLPYIALMGGLTATLLVLALSWERGSGGGFSPQRMTLTGVIVGAILNALVMALVLSMSEANTELAILWLAGSLYARDFSHILPTLPWTLAGLLAITLLARNLSALRFDTASAQSMGVNLRATQPLLIVLAASLAASGVAVAGPVGFVGLLVPYIAKVIGIRHMPYQIWVCCFVGAALVVASDTLGRIVAAPTEVPVGIITSLIGAPLFALILNRNFRN